METLTLLADEHARLSNLVVKAEIARRTNAAVNELLKLRGELGLLRREVDSLKNSTPQKGSIADLDPKLAQALAHSKLAYAEEVARRAWARFESGVISNEDYGQARANYEMALAEERGDAARVREIKAVLAGMRLTDAEARREAGLISSDEYAQAKVERDLAVAELNGNAVEAARVKLDAAEAKLQAAEALRQAGLEGEEKLLRARLERDTAAAEHAALVKGR